jgi:hypothetical protein
MAAINLSASRCLLNAGFRSFASLTVTIAAFALICSAQARGACVTATMGGGWQNSPMSSQTGTFTATFDATPSASPTNSVVALSNGAQTAYANFACLARFNPSGDIDARNGGAYAAASTIPYSAGVSYHFRLAVNIAAQTYSIFVTPAGGSELTVGTNFGFRISDTTLNYWGVFVDSGSGGAGSVTVCNFSTGGSLPQASTPSFSPAPGTYSSAQLVSIATATSGASIRYTTDGGTPSEISGTLYSGSVNISTTTTLKAIAYASGFTDSTIASGAYTISVPPPPQVATPTFSPGAGTYTSAQSVTLSDSTSGASIRYTTDSSTPSETAGTLYSGPVNISATTTLKAIGYKSGMTDSAIIAATYTISSSSGCVTATAGGGWQNSLMSLQSGTFTATFDATPTASPTNSVVALSNGAQTAYANFACLTRFNPSGDIDARNGGAYAAASTIPYSAGVSYHFRLVVNIAAQTYSIFVTPAGGSELTVGSNYAFRISDTTLNWYGVFVDVSASGGAGTVTVCNFSTGTSPGQAATPSFNPAPGTYSSAQSVSITTATSGASIRYTTNGSTPSETAGTLYSGPVSISATETLKAIAYTSGLTDSTVASGTYTIGSTGGNFTAAQVLAGVQSHMTSSVQVNTLPHINTMTRALNVNVYQVTTGVFAYTSSMAIDDDGSDPDPDPDHQNQTTWQDSSGAQLGAHHVPYYVLGDDCWDNEKKQGGNFHPCPHFFYSDWNITGLQFALIFYNGKCIGAVFGDTQGTDVTSTSSNDSRELGEASVESAVLLGIPSSGTTGGVDNGVTVVVFSGPQWVVKGTNQGTGPVGSATGSLNGNAQAMVQQALNQLGNSFGL